MNIYDCEQSFAQQIAKQIAATSNLFSVNPSLPHFQSMATIVSVAPGAQRYLFPPANDGEWSSAASAPGVTAPQNLFVGSLTLNIKPAATAVASLGNIGLQMLGGNGLVELFSSVFVAAGSPSQSFNIPFITGSALILGNDAASDDDILFSAKFDGWVIQFR